ncbi:flagellar hook-associated protein 2 [Paenibacillus sp. yr247]|uniref:flagellar filament capping protein FliD n=1 Tax=Paenibacillus sp. yr247 TaxID=1761880 RepID=UPI00088DB500|nr:flagellar filament capping protein FliD [Paenibacillus sp. yr247]SDO61500.1 flagellar hook-associated protein 2 [Paenibacillus sp. yr247]
MVMRITGLSSGMDIDGMVSKLMKAEQLPIDNLNKQKTKNEWLQDSYRAVNTAIYPLSEQGKQLQYNYNWPTASGTDASGNPVFTQADKDAIYAKINSFVSTYNDTSVALKSKLDETVEQSFQPLTSDQKKAMSDVDIKNWEIKAKQGLLRGDTIVSKAYLDLRSDVTTEVTGIASTYKSLADIGVTTGVYNKYDPSTAGKLYIDSTKLKAAIDADPQAAINLFTTHGTGTDRGIAQRIYEDAGNRMTEISKKAGSTNGSYTSTFTSLGKKDNDLAQKIADMTEKLSKKEDQFYRMFSTMETAIEKGNSQMSWLHSQMG